jgi:flagellar basal body rod protein FlgG
VPDESHLTPRGGTLFGGVDVSKLERADGTLQSGFLEESNVDPMTELTQLIQAQRQLEANANMIRYQDQTLSKLVNEVGKIG